MDIEDSLRKMDIVDLFRNQLLTAVLSSPIVYIPHFHHSYVDAALLSIFPQKGDKSKHSVTGLDSGCILEFTIPEGVVNFTSKFTTPSDEGTKFSKGTTGFSQILTSLIKGEKITTISGDEAKIIVFKSCAEAIKKNNELQSLLQTFAELYEQRAINPLTTIILVDTTPISELAPSIKDIVSAIELPIPTYEDIEIIVKNIPVSDQYESTPGNKMGIQNDLCRNLQGLQFYEIDQVLRSALVRSNGKITERTLQYVLEEKKMIVKKSGIIDVREADESFNDVGGLDVLRKDLEREAVLFKNLRDVHKYKIPLPKGVLVIGMPGCGKSLIAKSIAHEFGVSLLRLDVSRLMGQYVGQSEENMRKALATAEAAHPCVLWIDEIEKAFHGTNSSGNDNDMLVMRMMGYFLTWMQERSTAVYIVATANDVMRPEFMRKGRFDEVYFVDFPSGDDARAILDKKLEPYAEKDLFDLKLINDSVRNELVKEMAGFAGSEIESVVRSVMAEKFKDSLLKRGNDHDKELETVVISKDDFIKVIQSMRDSVMSRQDNPAIERMRELKSQYKFKNASTNCSDDDNIGNLREKIRQLNHSLEEKRLSDEISKLEKEKKEFDSKNGKK